MAFSGVDEQIKCLDCGNEFTFSVKDQEFYERQGFGDKPKRCKPCREAKKAKREGQRQQNVQEYPAPEMEERGRRQKTRHRRG